MNKIIRIISIILLSLFTYCKDHKSKQAEEGVNEIMRITFDTHLDI